MRSRRSLLTEAPQQVRESFTSVPLSFPPLLGPPPLLSSGGSFLTEPGLTRNSGDIFWRSLTRVKVGRFMAFLKQGWMIRRKHLSIRPEAGGLFFLFTAGHFYLYNVEAAPATPSAGTIPIPKPVGRRLHA